MDRRAAQPAERLLTVFMALVLVIVPVLSENNLSAQSAQRPAPIFKIAVAQGEGAVDNLRQRVAREVIVKVTDENDNPVGGVAIAFTVASEVGSGGAFATGATTFTAVTSETGLASAGFSHVPGVFQINVTAALQGQVIAATAITSTSATTIAAAVPTIGATGAAGAGAGAAAGGAAGTVAAGVGVTTGGISALTIGVVAGVVVAAAAVGVVAAKNGDDGGPETPGTPTVRIDPGTPSVGAPGGWQNSKLKPQRPKWR